MTNGSQQAAAKIAVSVSEAASLSDIGRTKLYEAIKLGELESIKIGAWRLILVDELKAWLSKHRVV